MKDTVIKDQIATIKAATVKATATKESALQFLRDAGIVKGSNAPAKKTKKA
ncbi:hypothetical protein ACTHGU_14765 [Chitinophagaceae bacterium MMS25-I14]